jgi:putative ABC transport system permease protein
MNFGPILRAMNHNRVRVTLLVLEIALTLAIVTNCVNIIIAERRKMSVPSGFDDDNILWVHGRPFAQEYRDDAFVNTIIDADLRAIQAIPGVKAVANTHFRLWEGGGSSTQVSPSGTKQTPVGTQIYWGTKDTLKVLGSRIIEGRDFNEGDHNIGPENDNPKTVIISKTVADTLFPNGSAVGKSIVETDDNGQAQGTPLTIVGVFERFFNPFGVNPDTWRGVADRAMFVPTRVGGYGYGVRYLVRTEPGEMPRVMEQVEKVLVQADSRRVIDFEPTPEKKARWFAQARLAILVMTGLIIALIVVTALGIIGVTSLSVAERTRQIGTRRALGATRADILRHFLVENWIVTTAGLAVGVSGAYLLNFFLVTHVSDVKLHWQLIAGGMLLLWLNGLLSTIPPALRATMVPPSIATRSV